MRPSIATSDTSDLSETDAAAIIREIHEMYHSDARMEVSCGRELSSVRYQLLHAAPLDQRTLAVRLLQIPVDRRGRAIAGLTTAPQFVVAKTGGQWELVGRPMPAASLTV